MSLQDRLNQQKQKQSITETTGNSSRNIQLQEELSEVKEQNNLLRERMLQIERLQNERNQKINSLLERLESATTDWNSRVDKATEQVSQDLLITQKRAYNEIEENFKKQNKLNQKFHKVQGFSFFALSIAAMVLFIALIARTLALGVWKGLFLSQLFHLGEWYWSVLAVLIVAGLVIGLLILIFKGLGEVMR